MPVSPLSITFGTELGFEPDETVLRIAGDVDMLTAPVLTAIMVSVVEHGHRHFVVDLAGLTFLDASGLGAIANTLTHLRALGRSLTLRSVPAATMHLLETTGLDDLVRIEAGDEDAQEIAQLASLPGAGRAVDDALQLVTTLAARTVKGADGVSVSLHLDGRLGTVAATDETVQRMDDHQYETAEGPCISAAAEGRRFLSDSLRDERRWPAFVPRATSEGIASILSTPLVADGQSLGALNIYSNTDRVFGFPEQELAGLFASQAAGVLLAANVDEVREELSGRVVGALLQREAIAQAQGMLMARDGLTAEAAAAALFRGARAAELAVLVHAQAIVASAVHRG